MRSISTTACAREQRSKRYRTELPTSINGVSGIVHNVSTTGLYIFQNQRCETGSRIDYWVDLGTRGGRLKLCCEGEVVRVDQIDHRFGIGIKTLSQVMKTAN